MASPKDIENMMRDAAMEEAAHTRERYSGTADEVYGRLKGGLPERLRSATWYKASYEGVEFNDELRLAVISIRVKRGSVVGRATVSDAGLVDGSPASDVALEFVVLQESKLLKPDQLASGQAIMYLKSYVWGDYLGG